jgi:mercuric ion transport protein
MSNDMSRLSLDRSEQPVAAVGAAAGFTALFSAAACCVIPAALALAGLGAGGLATIVPWHWPLTIASGLAVALGWALYLRKGGLRVNGTFWLLSASTAFVLLSAVWKLWFEAPLRDWLLSL